MKKLLLAGTTLLLIGIGVAGCYNDNAEELYPQPTGGSCDTTNVTYTGTLKTIVDNQCAISGCHAGAVPTGFDLSTYNGLKIVGNGKLIPAITHTGPFPMPQGMPKLDDCTIAKFQAWVNNGMPQ